MEKIKKFLMAVLVRVTLIYYIGKILKFIVKIPSNIFSKVENIQDDLHDKKVSKMRKESEKLRELNEAQRELESAKKSSGIESKKENGLKGVFNKLKV